MHLDINTLPAVLELNGFSGVVRLVPDDADPITEVDYIITAVRASKSDSGIILDFSTDPTQLSISGSYQEQFSHRIGYTEPQVDVYTAPVKVFTKTWASVPEPEEIDLIWFLFEYTPPSTLTSSIVYEVDVSWIERDETLPGEPVDTEKTDTFMVSQIVNYDIDTNVSQFKKYYPDPDPLP